MNIEEAKERKLELDQKIKTLLMEFEEDTGLNVTDVTLVLADAWGNNPSRFYAVHTRVEMLSI